MQVIINGEHREFKVASISTLLDVVCQLEKTFQQGQIITEVTLNEKVLTSDWYQNSSKIYLLDDDVLELKLEDSSMIAQATLINSKETFEVLLKDFEMIADAFRLMDEADANAQFIQGIENLQWFLKVLEDATFLLGRPLDQIMDRDVVFTEHINQLSTKLEKIIGVQFNKDWIMLADMIEYEMLPALKKVGTIYQIFGV